MNYELLAAEWNNVSRAAIMQETCILYVGVGNRSTLMHHPATKEMPRMHPLP